MPIYTKTGDTGETGIFGGKRVSKASLGIEACGQLDEATSVLGVAVAELSDGHIQALCIQAQKDLYTIMAYIAGASVAILPLLKHVHVLEQNIDTMEATLPKLTQFIIPGGGPAAAHVHAARACVRTAERAVVRYYQEYAVADEEVAVILQYINRLSDYLFTAARFVADDEVTV